MGSGNNPRFTDFFRRGTGKPLPPVFKKLEKSELYSRSRALHDKLVKAGVHEIKMKKSTVAVLQGELDDGRTIRIIATMDPDVYKHLKQFEKQLLEIGEVLAPEPVIFTEVKPGKIKEEIKGTIKLPVHAEQHAAEYARELGMKGGVVATSIDGCPMCEAYLKEFHPDVEHMNYKSAKEARKKRTRSTGGSSNRTPKKKKKTDASVTAATTTDLSGRTKTRVRKPRTGKKKTPAPATLQPRAGLKKIPDDTVIAIKKPTDAAGLKPRPVAAKTLTGTLPDTSISLKPQPKIKQDIHVKPHIKIKISPKIRSGAMVLLELGLDFLTSYFDGKRYQNKIASAIKKNEAAFEQLIELPSSQEELLKFRVGKQLEDGYQLFFKVRFLVTQYYNDSIFSLDDVFFIDVTLERKNAGNRIPDPDEQGSNYIEHNGQYGLPGILFIPVFKNGEKINNAAENAADNRFEEFKKHFVERTSRFINDPLLHYLFNFRKYTELITHSPAHTFYQNFFKGKKEEALAWAEYGMIDPMVLMNPPYQMQFHEVVDELRWAPPERRKFIRDYQLRVMQMEQGWKVYYQTLYDKYFRELDDPDCKCNTVGNRGNGNRMNLDRISPDNMRLREKPLHEPPALNKTYTSEQLKELENWMLAAYPEE